jgi:hypothetical protein
LPARRGALGGGKPRGIGGRRGAKFRKFYAIASTVPASAGNSSWTSSAGCRRPVDFMSSSCAVPPEPLFPGAPEDPKPGASIGFLPHRPQ